MTRFKGYRTIIYNVIVGAAGALLAVLPALMEFMGDPEVLALVRLDGRIEAYWLVGLAVGGWWLRMQTTTPVGRTDE